MRQFADEAGCLGLANERLIRFDELIRQGAVAEYSGELKVGVDLGTANIVISVADGEDKPVAGITATSRVVRDGIVVDYAGAVAMLRRMKTELEERLGRKLTRAATGIPPGIIAGNVRCIANVVEGAGFDVSAVVDEPTAAASVLGIENGAVVDVGGGTTGISILEDNRVIFTGDEPTGGYHMTLVLAGFYRCPTDEAELMKRDPGREDDVFTVVRPVVEKMAAIVAGYLRGYKVDRIYVVGGACSFSRFEEVFERFTGVQTIKPAAPLLVTPLGLAMNAK